MRPHNNGETVEVGAPGQVPGSYSWRELDNAAFVHHVACGGMRVAPDVCHFNVKWVLVRGCVVGPSPEIHNVCCHDTQIKGAEMTVAIEEKQDGKVIEVSINGKLGHSDYELFVPMTESRIKQFGKVSMLVVLNDFHGWDAAALWDDLKFDFKHFSDIDRLALVGDSKWEKGMSVFCKPFTSAEIKYFDRADLEAARLWVEGS